VNLRFTTLLPRTTLAALSLQALVLSVPAHAQSLPPADPGAMQGAPLSADRLSLATNLISEAFNTANQKPAVRATALRGAAALLPRLQSNSRDTLTRRWLNLALSSGFPRETRLQALSAFFDVAARYDVAFADRIARGLPDASGRASGFLALSEAFHHRDWTRSNDYALLAQRAARQEEANTYRARSLTFVAQNLAILNPVERDAAVREASVEVRRLVNSNERDYLLSEVVTAAAKFDLPLARKMANDISNDRLKNIAQARANLSEISQTTLSDETSDRIGKLAKASARYDQRALPILLQLPATPDVFKALSDALPPISPTSGPSINPMILERLWNFAASAEPSVYRDQLQSRLARLMVLQDLWRGRSWGKQLAWKGGRVQVGAFLKQVIAARQSALRIDPLQDLAQRNVQRAILEARALPPQAKVEALLLIAGQVLG
jgi:hypothetical protein